jgi:hypothetical protein
MDVLYEVIYIKIIFCKLNIIYDILILYIIHEKDLCMVKNATIGNMFCDIELSGIKSACYASFVCSIKIAIKKQSILNVLSTPPFEVKMLAGRLRPKAG